MVTLRVRIATVLRIVARRARRLVDGDAPRPENDVRRLPGGRWRAANRSAMEFEMLLGLLTESSEHGDDSLKAETKVE